MGNFSSDAEAIRAEFPLYMSRENVPVLLEYLQTYREKLPELVPAKRVMYEQRVGELDRASESQVLMLAALLKDEVYMLSERLDSEDKFPNWARRRKLNALID